MIKELSTLENKVAEVVALCLALRSENARLRLQMASAEKDRQHLSERMEMARIRIEQLVQQLPEPKSTVLS